MATDGQGTVEQVKERVSIVDAVSQYVKLERAGAAMKGRCPFHNERTPSFFVSPDRGTYHCFGCGEGGDVFSFVQKIEGLDFKGALKLLADKAGIEITYEKPEARDERDRQFALLEEATGWFEQNFAEQKDARAYMQKRGLTDGTLKTFQIGWAPDSWNGLTDFLKNKGYTEAEVERAGLAISGNRGRYDRFRSRIIFPISDSAGRVVGFSGRIFVPEGVRAQTVGADEPAKYINSPETALFKKSKILYGFDRAKQSIRKYNCSVLVEGQMDLVLSHQAGWSNTVAVSGTALTTEHVALLKRMSDNLILALDADQAGIAAAAKSARVALSAGMAVKVVASPPDKDPADVIVQEGAEKWRDMIRSAKPIVTFLLNVLEKSARDRDAFRRNALASVLPFISLMHSAVERESAAHEIAERLGVSESAVMSDLEKLAHAQPAQAPLSTEAHGTDYTPNMRQPSRVVQLFGILLWQRSLTEPTVSLQEVEAEIAHAAGEKAMQELEAIAAEEQERARFIAEALYTNEKHLPRVITELAHTIERDRLKAEVEELTLTLRQAEKEGDPEAQKRLLTTIQKRSQEIAKLDKLR